MNICRGDMCSRALRSYKTIRIRVLYSIIKFDTMSFINIEAASILQKVTSTTENISNKG